MDLPERGREPRIGQPAQEAGARIIAAADSQSLDQQDLDEFFNVQVKLVEPGYCPNTAFTSNGAQRMEGLIPAPYAPFAHPIFAAFAQPAAVTRESDVAEAVFRAATDSSGTLRFPAGPDAVALASASR